MKANGKNDPEITGSCLIADSKIFRNDKLIYDLKSENANSFFESVYRSQNINYPKFFKMDNLSKLGFLTSEILLNNNNLSEKYDKYEIGILLANSNSSLDTDLKYLKTLEQYPSPAVFVYTLPNIVIGEICIRNGFKGENTFFITKEFDPEMMISYLKNLFSLNVLKACIFGWVDLLKDDYTAALWMIEADSEKSAISLSIENINNTYKK